MAPQQTEAGWIGRRIARLRGERGWSLAALGGRVELSSTQLSRIESGTRQPSVGTLIEIARAFGVSLSELVADEPAGSYHVVRSSERNARDSANGAMTLLSGDYPRLQAIHLAVSPANPAPSARHAGEEWLYVLSGSIEVTVGDDKVHLRAHDAIHFPSKSPHSVRCSGRSTAQLLLVSSE